MKAADLQPNTIYRVGITDHGGGQYFRTGPVIVVGSRDRWSDTQDGARRTHLVTCGLLHVDNVWGEDPAQVSLPGTDSDLVEAVRWVDTEQRGTAHTDLGHDLTFVPTPHVRFVHKLSTFTSPFDSIPESHARDERDDETGINSWVDVERPALVAEWGTEYYEEVRGDANRWRIVGSQDLPTRLALSKLEGPYYEREVASKARDRRAEKAENEARYAESAKQRDAERTVAQAFISSAVGSVPDALVAQTHNGFPNDVERARSGYSGWNPHSIGGNYSSGVDLAAPDADDPIGITATALAAISYAWQQVYGDSSWEDILVGVYERYHQGTVINHISVYGTADAERVAQYLPANYTITQCHYDDANAEVKVGHVGLVISGTDNAGWTAEGYVIPRLASGLITAELTSTTRSI